MVSQYSNICLRLPNQQLPGEPYFAAATTDTITITFTKRKSIGEGAMIEKYKIEESANSQHAAKSYNTQNIPRSLAQSKVILTNERHFVY